MEFALLALTALVIASFFLAHRAACATPSQVADRARTEVPFAVRHAASARSVRACAPLPVREQRRTYVVRIYERGS